MTKLIPPTLVRFPVPEGAKLTKKDVAEKMASLGFPAPQGWCEAPLYGESAIYVWRPETLLAVQVAGAIRSGT